MTNMNECAKKLRLTCNKLIFDIFIVGYGV